MPGPYAESTEREICGSAVLGEPFRGGSAMVLVPVLTALPMFGTFSSMAFRIRRDEDIADGLRRIAREQTDAALVALADPDALGISGTAFEVRKRCKKVRGVVRLAREPLGKDYRRANQSCRDAARLLAPLRDAHALVETFDRTMAARATEVPADAVASVRHGLDAYLASQGSGGDALAALGAADELLGRLGGRIDDWRFAGSGWELLGPGLQETYRRGTVANIRAQSAPTVRRLHELRRQVKYTRYHLRIVRSTSPSLVLPVVARFEELGDWLGVAHDLALVEEILRRKGAKRFGGKAVVAPVLDVVTAHRQELEQASLGLAARLYGERPEAFAERFGGYWTAWQEHGREPDSPWPPAAEPEPKPSPEPEPDSESQPVEATAASVPVEPEPESEVESGPVEASAASVPAERAPDGAPDGLDDLTVTRLRALARQQAIPGRSSMKRDELIEALRAVGTSAQEG